MEHSLQGGREEDAEVPSCEVVRAPLDREEHSAHTMRYRGARERGWERNTEECGDEKR